MGEIQGVTEYQILSGSDWELAAKVNEALAEGWVLVGGVVIAWSKEPLAPWAFQAMTRGPLRPSGD